MILRESLILIAVGVAMDCAARGIDWVFDSGCSLRPRKRNDGFCREIECGGVASDAAVYLARIGLVADNEDVGSVGVLKSDVIDAGKRALRRKYVGAPVNYF